MNKPVHLASVTAAALAAAVAMPTAAYAATDTATYVVVLRDGAGITPDAAANDARTLGGAVRHVYRHAIRGFAITLPENAVERLRARPYVQSVDADGVGVVGPNVPSLPVPAWGLDRIDQRIGLDGAYHYTATGEGVTAYVIDSGIRTTHAEFEGRAVTGIDVIDGGAADDCSSHGTHVAGTIGGKTYGVAKKVSLVAVRVSACTSSVAWSDLIAGIDWATGDHDLGEVAVANISIGGGRYSVLDAAVSALVADGVAVSVAAGNDTQDACRTSPANVPAVMTIGASSLGDTDAWFSNHGTCVDWYAPGDHINAATNTSNTATAVKSGTSMASPHNAGVSALYLQLNPTASPSDVATALAGKLTRNALAGPSVAFGNNHLLFTDF